MPAGPIELEELSVTLGLGDREHIAIVGGGGKTTTLFALGEQLPPTVVMTTTTKMGSERDDGRHVVLQPSDDALAEAVGDHERVLVWAARGDHRADGVAPEACDRWFRSGLARHLVVEADGSRGRPFKAPYPYEPVVPASSTLVIACIGAGALNRPIGEVCHRVDAVVDIVGGSDASTLTPERAARVLVSPEGSAKSVPENARFVVVVQRVTAEDRPAVVELEAALDGRAGLVAVAARTGLPARP